MYVMKRNSYSNKEGSSESALLAFFICFTTAVIILSISFVLTIDLSIWDMWLSGETFF